MDAVAIKESNNSENGCLITLCYFRNNSPISISNLVMYWTENNLLAGVDSIQSGIKLQYISTPSCLLSKCTIATYEN